MSSGETGTLSPTPGYSVAGAEPRLGGRTAAAWVLIAILVLGMSFRLRQYLARTSFFTDEASLVLNFRAHTAAELTRHLDYGQAAPPMFLWIGRAMYLGFGPSEYALRLLPLVGGVISLGLFGLLAWRVLPPWPAVFATGWFAFCEKLITYCSELKQYSTDVSVAVALVVIAIGWRTDRRPHVRLACLSIAAAIAFWLSHTAVIVFAALAGMLLWECLRESRRSLLLGLAGCMMSGLSFVTLYAISIRHQHDPYLFEFWAPGFPDWSRPLSWLPWLAHQTYELIYTPYPGLGVLFLILIVSGAIFAVQERRYEVLIASLGPVALTMLAACAHQYPLNGSRLTMFLFPGLFLIGAEALAGVQRRLGAGWQPAWWAPAGAVMLWGLAIGAAHAIHPRYNSHMRPVVAYVRQHLEPGEAIYLLGEPGPPGGPLSMPGRHHEFLAYWPDPPAVVHTQLDSADQIREERFWVAFAFRPHVKDFMRIFDQIQTVADPIGKPFVVKEGGAACLFELRKAPHARRTSFQLLPTRATR